MTPKLEWTRPLGHTLPCSFAGEDEWVESTLLIDGVQREHDGLYECTAINKGKADQG